jgi:hypothetical protein
MGGEETVGRSVLRALTHLPINTSRQKEGLRVGILDPPEPQDVGLLLHQGGWGLKEHPLLEFLYRTKSDPLSL